MRAHRSTSVGGEGVRRRSGGRSTIDVEARTRNGLCASLFLRQTAHTAELHAAFYALPPPRTAEHDVLRADDRDDCERDRGGGQRV